MLSPMDTVIILGIAVLVFGPKKLPELGRGLGKSLREFKEEVNSVKTDIKEAVDDKEIKNVAATNTIEAKEKPAQ